MGRLLTAKEVCAELGISEAILRATRKAGEIPYINIGRGTKREVPRYDYDDVVAWVNSAKKTAGLYNSHPIPKDGKRSSGLQFRGQPPLGEATRTAQRLSEQAKTKIANEDASATIGALIGGNNIKKNRKLLVEPPPGMDPKLAELIDALARWSVEQDYNAQISGEAGASDDQQP